MAMGKRQQVWKLVFHDVAEVSAYLSSQLKRGRLPR
jgi:hypothetical protein